MLPFQAAFAQNSAEIFDLHLGLSGEGSGLSRGFAEDLLSPGQISEISSDFQFSIQKRSEKVLN
jgi:hypothetical protein